MATLPLPTRRDGRAGVRLSGCELMVDAWGSEIDELG
jgi:hypothetical protein